LHYCKRWIPDTKANAGKQANLASIKRFKQLMANKFKQLQTTFTTFSNAMMNNRLVGHWISNTAHTIFNPGILDWTTAWMIIILTMFGLSILLVQLSNLLYR
jgi:hypothetical protein